jgi:hypothetical protein
MAKRDIIEEIEREFDFSKDKNLLNILQSSGKSRPVNDFPVLQYYLQDTQTYPFVKNYAEIPLNHVEFMIDFESFSKEAVYVKEVFEEKTYDSQVESAVYRLSKGYFAEINVGYHSLDDYATTVQDILRKLSKRESLAIVGSFTLYCPPGTSPLKNSELEKDIFELLKKHRIEKNITTPCIGMICQEDGDYYMKDFYIKKDYTLKNADLHYGEGFGNFHEKLMERFKEDSKGLVLFHGNPGTGKTYYIRSLMKELIRLEKYIIYLPPSMVENMVDPNMMNFLSSVVMDKAEEGKSCVLLLEDAEPLLSSRKTENRSPGITNLLNVTDGILNDMLNIQVIATFNTDLANIDEALLRPERLIARKQFKRLKKEDAQKLIDLLKIEKTATENMTLAEIYSLSHHREILIHEYNDDSRRIGFK